MENFINFFYTGQKVENGIYVCTNCGQKILIQNGDVLKKCLKCGLNKFTLYQNL